MFTSTQRYIIISLINKQTNCTFLMRSLLLNAIRPIRFKNSTMLWIQYVLNCEHITIFYMTLCSRCHSLHVSHHKQQTATDNHTLTLLVHEARVPFWSLRFPLSCHELRWMLWTLFDVSESLICMKWASVRSVPVIHFVFVLKIKVFYLTTWSLCFFLVRDLWLSCAPRATTLNVLWRVCLKTVSV